MFYSRTVLVISVFIVFGFMPIDSSAQLLQSDIAAGQAVGLRSQMRRQAHGACVQGSIKACNELIAMLNSPLPRTSTPTVMESMEDGEISGIRMDLQSRFNAACQNGSQFACDALRRLL